MYIMALYVIIMMLTTGVLQSSQYQGSLSLPPPFLSNQPLGRNSLHSQPQLDTMSTHAIYDKSSYMILKIRYYPNQITNSQSKSYNGNRDGGIRLMTWNKGNAYMENAMLPINQIINDHKPDVLTITEAQLRPETPIQLVQIPGYKLHTDSLYANGVTARTVTYSNSRLMIKT